MHKDTGKPNSVLFLTRHDYRARRKVNIHFFADHLVRRCKVRIFSFGFSWLSRIKRDARNDLWNESNKVVNHRGVENYLWRTLLHPVNLRTRLLLPLEKLLFSIYVGMAPVTLKQWIRESDLIIVESGFAIMLMRLCKQINPNATLAYMSSDSLETISCAPTIINEFYDASSCIDYAVITSMLMKPEMPKGTTLYLVPFAQDKSILQHADPSPYTGGKNIVSVGDMLFDRTFFEIAAEAFPDVTFHVIGGATHADPLNAKNIVKYDEMPFLKTIPYIKHANAGVAPYNGRKVSPFLMDTSMKLMQYGFLKVPAICPQTVVGPYPGRFGYIPGNKESIIAAVRNALNCPPFEGRPTLSWEEVTNRVIDPRSYPENLIKDSGQSDSFLIITRHDQRTSRKANIHFIAEELAKRDNTRIFSFAFSHLSRIKKDQRVELWNQSNIIAVHDGVENYLWRTPIHPVNLRKAFLRPIEKFMFFIYRMATPRVLKTWAKQSSVIIFESGFPIQLVRMCKKLNPSAKLVYLASDSLSTIDCAETIITEFEAIGPKLDYCILPSRKLTDEMPKGTTSYFVPHGLDKSILQHADPSPYEEGSVNIASVGSMLFDASFFEIAAEMFPDITFHVIGAGSGANHLKAPNIKLYGEMPFLDTIPYLAHANAGIAPYKGDKVSPFLIDTSMKLMQYGFLGIPAICPDTVVGNRAGRFGYVPGDKQSIIAAVKNALRSGRFESQPTLSWQDVAERIISPEKHSDTRI